MAEVLPVQMPHGVMSPGTYLRKRRAAAGIEPRALAEHLAGMPWPIGEPSRAQIDFFVAYLTRLELDQATLTHPQAVIFREAVPIDVTVYAELVLLRDAGPDSDLPRPSVCQACGCSFFNACLDQAGRPCAWVEGRTDLCTACAAADWPDAPQPEGAEA